MAIQYGPPSLPLNTYAPAFSRSGSGTARYTPPRRAAAPRRSQTTPQVANQQVSQLLAPQIAAQQAFAARQNAAIQGFAQALLGKMQPIAGQVGAAYDSAIQQTGALGQGAAQFLNAQNPSGPVADLLAQAGAPQQQIGQVTGQLGQTFGGGAGVLAYTGGAIPGGQLAAEKAAAVSQASSLPALAGLQGQQDLASALWQQGQDVRDIQGQRPALYQQAVQNITTNNSARARAALAARQVAESARQDQIQNSFKATSLNERAHEFDVTTKQRADQFDVKTQKQSAKDFIDKYVALTKLGLDTTKLEQDWSESQAKLGIAQQNAATSRQNAATSRQNANTSAARANNSAAANAARLQQSADRIALQKAKVTGIYNGQVVPGFKYNAKGKVVKAGSVDKPGGMTQGQWTSAYGKVNKMVDDFYHGVPERLDSKDQVIQAQQDPVMYGDAYRKIKALYPKMPKAKILEMLNLYYKEGEGGRPRYPTITPTVKGYGGQ